MDYKRLRDTVKMYKRGLLSNRDLYHYCGVYGMPANIAAHFAYRMWALMYEQMKD